MAACGLNKTKNDTQSKEEMDYNESIKKVSRWLEVCKNEFIGLQLYLCKTFKQIANKNISTYL
jgi:hypothetical protein